MTMRTEITTLLRHPTDPAEDEVYLWRVRLTVDWPVPPELRLWSGADRRVIMCYDNDWEIDLHGLWYEDEELKASWLMPGGYDRVFTALAESEFGPAVADGILGLIAGYVDEPEVKVSLDKLPPMPYSRAEAETQIRIRRWNLKKIYAKFRAGEADSKRRFKTDLELCKNPHKRRRVTEQ